MRDFKIEINQITNGEKLLQNINVMPPLSRTSIWSSGQEPPNNNTKFYLIKQSALTFLSKQSTTFIWGSPFLKNNAGLVLKLEKGICWWSWAPLSVSTLSKNAPFTPFKIVKVCLKLWWRSRKTYRRMAILSCSMNFHQVYPHPKIQIRN